jgi:hypothetical protein
MQLSGNYRGLILALSDPNGFTRAEAMSRLSKFRNNNVLESAIDHLENDPDFNVRSQACVALRGFIGNIDAIKALRKSLNDDHRLVRSKASFALAQMRAREALGDIVAMRAQGVEPDIADTVDTSIDILSTPDSSEVLLELAGERDAEGIGKLFDCMLKPDHDEIKNGLSTRGKNRMVDVFREWEREGRLSALDRDPEVYQRTRREYAQRLIEAL